MPAHAGQGSEKLAASQASSVTTPMCITRAIRSAAAIPKRFGTENNPARWSKSTSWQAYSTSKPPTHSVTAPHRINMRGSRSPVTAIHAAAGETPGVGVEKQNSERDRCQLECQRAQLPRREEKDHDRSERENQGKAGGESSRCQRSLCRARVFFVVAHVGDAVDGHCRASSGDHGDYNPEQLF